MSRMIVFALLVLASTSCGKGQESGDSNPAASPARPAGASPTASSNPRQDLTKPYLTDEKMVKYIKSPPAGIGLDHQARSLSDVKAMAEELNAIARKYGFENFEDYMVVASRIMVGRVQIAGDDLRKIAIVANEENIKRLEEEMKTPDYDPEMRKAAEAQIASSKKSLEDLAQRNQPGQNESPLNEADLALIKKYKAQLDQATQEAEQVAAKAAAKAEDQPAAKAEDQPAAQE